jgi:anaerobic selenocysteine-containing dehydrogenase
MGITQHRQGVQNVRMLCNLLFLRGNVGKPGAGPSPVRGHSNVQGQRTVGITEKPELAPLDKLAGQFHFEPPREKGMNTVEAFEAMIDGKVSAVVNLGGNLVRSVPDRLRIEPAWRNLRLTVNVATKLNRSHLVRGEKSYILPCLSRIEIDTQASGVQAVSMEDSTGCIHGSRGVAEPASPDVRSEPYIVAQLAKHTLGERSTVEWTAGATTMRSFARRSRRRIPRPFTTSTGECRRPAAFRAICPHGNANGRRKAARRSSRCRRPSARIRTCPSAIHGRCGP